MSGPFSSPGLYLHRGNSLEGQAALLAEILASAPLPPLRAEEVVVQSLGMARWLTLRLTEGLGVCAQVRFPFPRKFFDSLQVSAAGRVWQESAMTWALMDELLALGEGELPEVERYLQPGRGRDLDPGERTLRAYQLASRVARLFDQYLVYRPDMVGAWTAGGSRPPGAAWQADLWRRLKGRFGAGAGLDPVERHRDLLHLLAGTPGRVPGLPARAFFFGVTALPPFYLELLPGLARHLPVHLFLPQPTREFWSDLVSEGEERRLRRKADADFIQRGHPLLASWGTQGKEFQQALDTLADAGEGVDLFTDPAGPGLLATLQGDIFNLRVRGDSAEPDETFAEEPEPRFELPADDRSLSVHACAGPLREVEVLHDQLLAAFQELPGLEPREIMVMAPDIAVYAPYIETVFGAAATDDRAEAARRIPYRIADRTGTEANQIARVILRLFELARPGERYTATNILDLLEMPALRRGQGLEESALERIRAWVRDLPVYWGRDGEQRAALDLPAEPGQTWREGLERLLLGYGTGRHPGLLGELAPYANLNTEDWALLGRFGRLVNGLFTRIEELRREATAREWAERLVALLNTLFPELPPESEAHLREVREAIAELPAAAALAGLERPLPGRVVGEHLAQLFQLERHAYGFISGGVTFCALKPMRSIPFRVICVLGLNDRAFPRVDERLGFDLMAGPNRRPGDRSRREEDRYLFLEALLAARDRLILSYPTILPGETQKAEPSPLVIELLDYLDRSCAVPEGTVRDRLVLEHPLHAFDPRYYAGVGDERLFTFSRANLAAAVRKAEGPLEEPAATDFLLNPLRPDAELAAAVETHGRVPLTELIAMLKDPCKFFLTKRMELALAELTGRAADSEPFELNGLEEFKLRDRLLRAEEDLGDPAAQERLYRQARAEGLLPHGQPGRLTFGKACVDARLLARVREQLGLTLRAGPLIGSFPVGAWEIEARFDLLFEERLVTAQTAALNGARQLEFWLRHLALGQLEPRPEASLAFGFKDRKILGYALPVSTPHGLGYLERLLALRETALNEPLRFVPEPALRFVEKDDLQKARKAAEDALKKHPRTRGKDQSAAWRDLCFPGGFPLGAEFEALAREIWTPYVGLREDAAPLLKLVAA